MNLDDVHIAGIRALLEEGASIADVQRYLSEKLAVSMTFMDTRFLLDDLDLELKKEQISNPEPKSDDSLDLNNQSAPSGVQVEISPIQELGTLASGTVVFSDGVSAKFFVDEQGQLGVSGAPQGYAPTKEDAVEFQNYLRTHLQNRV